jgi:hypothetical protein
MISEWFIGLWQGFIIPLLRGGAEGRGIAGVCFCDWLIKAETHPSTPLKRGIAQSRPFYSVIKMIISFLPPWLKKEKPPDYSGGLVNCYIKISQ